MGEGGGSAVLGAYILVGAEHLGRDDGGLLGGAAISAVDAQPHLRVGGRVRVVRCALAGLPVPAIIRRGDPDQLSTVFVDVTHIHP